MLCSIVSAPFFLSRWAGTDRILVEEFNDNCDKIDAALTTALLEKRAIKTVTLTEPAINNVISLDEIDWAEWSFVGIELPYDAGNGILAHQTADRPCFKVLIVCFHDRFPSFFLKTRHKKRAADVQPDLRTSCYSLPINHSRYL